MRKQLLLIAVFYIAQILCQDPCWGVGTNTDQTCEDGADIITYEARSFFTADPSKQHSFWQPNFCGNNEIVALGFYDGATWTTNSSNNPTTGILQGELYVLRGDENCVIAKNWTLHAEFIEDTRPRTEDGDPGYKAEGPISGSDVDITCWRYYTILSEKSYIRSCNPLTRICETYMILNRIPKFAFQVGYGANVKNLQFGGSIWTALGFWGPGHDTFINRGDINIDLHIQCNDTSPPSSSTDGSNPDGSCPEVTLEIEAIRDHEGEVIDIPGIADVQQIDADTTLFTYTIPSPFFIDYSVVVTTGGNPTSTNLAIHFTGFPSLESEFSIDFRIVSNTGNDVQTCVDAPGAPGELTIESTNIVNTVTSTTIFSQTSGNAMNVLKSCGSGGLFSVLFVEANKNLDDSLDYNVDFSLSYRTAENAGETSGSYRLRPMSFF